MLWGQSRRPKLPIGTLKAQRRVNEKDSRSEACFASEGTGDRRKPGANWQFRPSALAYLASDR